MKSRLALLGLALALLLPVFVDNRYILDVATSVLIYMILALGLDIVAGHAGLLDLGYSAFFAIGAYCTGILTTSFNWSFWATIPVALMLAAISGVVIGWPTLRLRSDYLAIVTLGFGEIVRVSALNLAVTGGPQGIFGIPRPTLFGYRINQPRDFYYLLLALVVLTVIAVSRLAHSRIGRALAFVREDEAAASAVGINPVAIKLTAYMAGALLGGLAGSFYAVKMSAIASETFTFVQSVMILLAVVLGGMSSLPGVMIGAALIVILPEALRDFARWRMLLFGLALIPMMIFRPQGIWPTKNDSVGRG